MMKRTAAGAMLLVTTLGLGAGPAFADDRSSIGQVLDDSSALFPEFDLVVGIDDGALGALLLPAVQAAREAASRAASATAGFDLGALEELPDAAGDTVKQIAASGQDTAGAILLQLFGVTAKP